MNDRQLSAELRAIRTSHRWAFLATVLCLIMGILTMWSVFSGSGYIGGDAGFWVLLPLLGGAIYFERDARKRTQQLSATRARDQI